MKTKIEKLTNQSIDTILAKRGKLTKEESYALCLYLNLCEVDNITKISKHKTYQSLNQIKLSHDKKYAESVKYRRWYDQLTKKNSNE